MESTVKERIKKFIEHKKISVREFERRCNLSNGYVNGIDQTIMPNKVSIINQQFPELNIGWLLSGSGEMLLAENDKLYENQVLKDVKEEMGLLLRLSKINKSVSLTDKYEEIDNSIDIISIFLHKYNVKENMGYTLKDYRNKKVEWVDVLNEFKKRLEETLELYEILKPYKAIIDEIYEKIFTFNDKRG